MANHDIDTLYGLLTEGHLDLMYLPSGAVTWLWQDGRPEAQIEAARQLGVEAKRLGDEIVGAGLLRADQNVLVLKTKSGHRINIYPAGGYGMDGQPYDINRIGAILGGGREMLGMAQVSQPGMVLGQVQPESPMDAMAATVVPETPNLEELAFDIPAEEGLGMGDLM